MNNKKTQNSMFPFTYTEWDPNGGDYGGIQFYNVEFTSDFGPIEQNSKFDCVSIEPSCAKLTCYNCAGAALHEIKYKCVTI
jgi:hypothetical protein